MTYKINQFVEHIVSPVCVVIGNQKIRCENGKQLAETSFDEFFLIDKVYLADGEICVSLKENDMIHTMNWIGEESISFF